MNVHVSGMRWCIRLACAIAVVVVVRGDQNRLRCVVPFYERLEPGGGCSARLAWFHSVELFLQPQLDKTPKTSQETPKTELLRT